METEKVLNELNIGLSRLLRYSFGGFLSLFMAFLINPTYTEKTLKVIPWELSALSALVMGAGIYAAHRSLVIPIHHLILCFILWVWERIGRVQKSDLTSPTRWLGGIGVPRFRRMLAYTALRRSCFFGKDKEDINIQHAEGHLIVMIAEGFLAASFYAKVCPCKSQISCLVLFILFVFFFVASYPHDIGQHILECMRFRVEEEKVKNILLKQGILPKTENAS